MCPDDVEQQRDPGPHLAVAAAIWQQQPCRAVVELLRGAAAKQHIDACAQQAVLDMLCSPLCQAAPPSAAYVARLVKQLISAAEEGGQELAEPLLQLQVSLLQGSCAAAAAAAEQGQQGAGSWRYKTFLYASRPCWQQLQQQQLLHAHAVAAAVSASQLQAHGDGDRQEGRKQQQQQPRGGNPEHSMWLLPAHLRQRLQQQQHALRQLLGAAGLLPKGSGVCSMCAPPIRGVQAWQLSSTGCSCGAAGDGQSARHASTPSSSGGGSSGAGLVTIHASDNMFEGGTGCHMWDAGFLLAEFVINHQHIFAGQRVLEVGCGPGLVAACLCRAGASRVLLTDGDPQTLVNCLSNLALNGHPSSQLLGSWEQALPWLASPSTSERAAPQPPSAPQVLACPLDWHQDVPGLCPDVVVGSDVCYDPGAVPDLVRLLQQLLPCGAAGRGGGGCGPEAFISTTKRHPSTLQLFLDLAEAAGLEVTQVPTEPQLWPIAGCGADGAGSSSSSCRHGRAASARDAAVVFQQLPALQGDARERYVLHRVVRRRA